MKKASCPFGYAIYDGQIVVDDIEKIVVEKIYSDYLENSSAAHIATVLNTAGVAYKNERSWNKNIIYRILDDARYMGKDGYPVIVRREQWESVAQHRKSNATEYMDDVFLEIRRKMACARCGGAFIRNKQRQKSARWECKECKVQTPVIADADIRRLVFDKINSLVGHPETICQGLDAEPINLDIVRQQRQFERFLMDPGTSAKQLDKLAKQITQLRYQAIDPKNQAFSTEQILKALREVEASQKEKTDLLRQIVSRVLVDKIGGVQLKLINGQVL